MDDSDIKILALDAESLLSGENWPLPLIIFMQDCKFGIASRGGYNFEAYRGGYNFFSECFHIRNSY